MEKYLSDIPFCLCAVLIELLLHRMHFYENNLRRYFAWHDTISEATMEVLLAFLSDYILKLCNKMLKTFEGFQFNDLINLHLDIQWWKRFKFMSKTVFAVLSDCWLNDLMKLKLEQFHGLLSY